MCAAQLMGLYGADHSEESYNLVPWSSSQIVALQGGSRIPGNDTYCSILLIQSMCKLLPRSNERCPLLMRFQHQCIPLLKHARQRLWV